MVSWQPPYDFAAARPTFIDVWPQAWLDLMPPYRLVPLSSGMMNALGRQISGFRHLFTAAPSSALYELTQQLDAAIAELNRSCFIRLTTRSPKDSLYAQRHGIRIINGIQALAIIIGGSARCAADIRMALESQTELAIVVRRWVDFPSPMEFRCFMVGRSWVGASQTGEGVMTNSNLHAPEDIEVCSMLQQLMDRVTCTSSITNAVFDVACVLDATDEKIGWRPILLDVNPLLTVTDLGHYTGLNDFDHCIRFNSSENSQLLFRALTYQSRLCS